MASRAKTWLVVTLALIVLVGGLAGVKAAQILRMMDAGQTFVPPPVTVGAVTVAATEWQPMRSAVATLVAARGVTLGAELAGTVRDVSFDSGTFVKAGSALVRLDVSTETAQIEAARAEAALARLDLERARSLRQQGAGSQADLDSAEARDKRAAASVAALEATIRKKTIRAPFDGRIAIREVEVGQVVSTGTPVASLQSVDPIQAEFSMPQQALADLVIGQHVVLRTDVFPGARWEGSVTAINTEVDPATRQVRVRATLPNTDERLRPGMFGGVDVVAGAPRSVLAIPAPAVLFAPYGDSVFVVESSKGPKDIEDAAKRPLVARQKFIRLGERRGDLVEVVSGLSPGDRVVDSGAFKLRNGSTVVVKNDLTPKADLAPHPAEE
jgi:membrane fusion protein (multidrug efflux system)